MSEFRLTEEQKQREREIVADKFYDEIVRIRREYDEGMARINAVPTTEK